MYATLRRQNFKRRTKMSFMLEELKPDEVNHLKVFDLNTWRGWAQLVGLVGFAGMSVFAFGLFLTSAVKVHAVGFSDIDAVLDMVVGVYAMLPIYFMVRAIKGKHLGAAGLIFMSVFPPIGLYFAWLRYMDSRLFKKVLRKHSRVHNNFIVMNKS